MSQHEVLLGELQLYSDNLREWSKTLKNEDVCSKIMSETENKDEMMKRYNLCKSLNLMEQQFQIQLYKHAASLMKLMNKLQDVVQHSEDMKEVVEKGTSPDVLYCEKVVKPPGGWPSPPDSDDKPPAPKKLKKSKKIKLNTDCAKLNNNDNNAA